MCVCARLRKLCWRSRARLVEQYGEGSWSKLVPHFAGRIGKQLRERWNHELRPDIQKGAWSAEEEDVLVAQHRIHRNAWADIAKARARAHTRACCCSFLPPSRGLPDASNHACLCAWLRMHGDSLLWRWCRSLFVLPQRNSSGKHKSMGFVGGAGLC